MKKLTLLLSISILVTIGCYNPFSSNNSNNQPPINDTTVEYTYDNEAATMAMWYYDSLKPPDSLAQKIYNEMSLIDTQWNDSISDWSIDVRSEASLHPDMNIQYLQFISPWVPSILFINFTAASFATIKDKTHLQFYALINQLDFDSLYIGTANNTRLYFNGLQNSGILTNMFDSITGTTSIDIKRVFDVGGYSNIFPYLESDNPKYFYIFSWGDCPAGCINSHIFYFEIQNNNAVLIDTYNSIIDNMYTPNWLDTLMIPYSKWCSDYLNE